MLVRLAAGANGVQAGVFDVVLPDA
jgi:hypothetical protein